MGKLKINFLLLFLRLYDSINVRHNLIYSRNFYKCVFLSFGKNAYSISHTCSTWELCRSNRSCAFFGVCDFGCAHFFIFWSENYAMPKQILHLRRKRRVYLCEYSDRNIRRAKKQIEKLIWHFKIKTSKELR